MERSTKVLKTEKYARRASMDGTNGLQPYNWRNIRNIAKRDKTTQYFQLPNNIEVKIIPIICYGLGRQFLPQTDNFSAYIYRNWPMACLDLPFFSKRPTKEKIIETLRKYQIDIKYILHVDTIQPRKNLIRLIKTFSILAYSYSDLKQVLAGKLGWMCHVWDFGSLFLYTEVKLLCVCQSVKDLVCLSLKLKLWERLWLQLKTVFPKR